MVCIEKRCGDSLNAIGQPNHAIYNLECCHYDRWQNEFKKTLDPNDAADAGFYTDPDFAAKIPPEHAQRVLERVMGDVIKIEEREIEEGIDGSLYKHRG